MWFVHGDDGDYSDGAVDLGLCAVEILVVAPTVETTYAMAS
jgi:hypothetical protein|tara:strand:+ start:251 stop:373 length:123 start_codon:yes stop_codon:yes gene_type:complete